MVEKRSIRGFAGAKFIEDGPSVLCAPCDILIAAHPNLTNLWSVIDEHGKGDRAKLIDPSSCKRYAAAGKERLDKRLADERSTQ